ncbi:hypothetical protein BM1_06525 [Bipolaris maydis]|nr:hypothetical protein BM1_06525 [Bipolaris maydis]
MAAIGISRRLCCAGLGLEELELALEVGAVQTMVWPTGRQALDRRQEAGCKQPASQTGQPAWRAGSGITAADRTTAMTTPTSTSTSTSVRTNVRTSNRTKCLEPPPACSFIGTGIGTTAALPKRLSSVLSLPPLLTALPGGPTPTPELPLAATPADNQT